MAGLISTQLMKLAKKYNCIGAFKEYGMKCSECDERERCELLNLEGISNGDELLSGNESRRLSTLTRKFEKAGVPWKRKKKSDKSKPKRKTCRCKK
jgi:hypothetical protein